MLITPEVKHGIVNRVQNTIFSYQGWPTVARDENGTLYAVASGFRAQHICPFGKTVMYISKNNGETWTPPIVINDTYLDDRDAGILYMGGGRMLVTWFTHPTEVYLKQYYNYIKNAAMPLEAATTLGAMGSYQMLPENERFGGSYIRVSEDYGVTWSDTIKVPISSPHGPNLLRDGSLVYLGKEMYSDEIPAKSTCAYKSTDGGYTWTKLGQVPYPADHSDNIFHEPHVIELDDGRLLGGIRVEHTPYTVYTTISEDDGVTWSTPKPTGFNGSPPHFLKHSSGALICCIGRREQPYGQRAMVSYDNGETWEDEYILDESPNNSDLGYPSSVELDDGSILTVYYQRWQNDAKCSILYTKWNLKK